VQVIETEKILQTISTSKKLGEVMSEHDRQVWGIILADGEEKRLQLFIYSQYGTNAPKQYCTLLLCGKRKSDCSFALCENVRRNGLRPKTS
jgi:hypothetical protein